MLCGAIRHCVRGAGLRCRGMALLSPDEWQAVRLSLIVAGRAVGFGLPLAVLTATALARGRFPGRWLLDTVVHLPLVVPPVVTGWLLLVLFGVRGPLGAPLLQWFGVRLVFTTNGAALATAVMAFPLMVRAIRLSLEGVDARLEAAARTLGAGRLDRFFHVTVPLMMPGILSGAVVAFAAGMGEFGAVITFAANIPGETQTLPLAIYGATQQAGGDAVAGRLAVVSVVLAGGGLLAADWLARRGAAGAGGLTLAVAARVRLGGFELGVAFEAPVPGVCAVFGPSGCGKSTLLGVVAGLLRPPGARVELDGVDLAALPAERRRCGVVFQDARLFPHMSVRTNLLFGLRRAPRGLAGPSLDEVVELLGIGALLARRPGALSGGERQRVAVGRALLSRPRLLLMDEPLAALDAPRRAEILPYLQRVRDEAGVPILYVTHALDEVVRLADTLVVMEAGRVTACGTLGEVMARTDLPVLTERRDAGVVLSCTVAGHDAGRGLTELRFAGGTLRVPLRGEAAGTAIRMRLRARDVTVAAGVTPGLSTHNQVPAVVAGVEAVTPHEVLVRMDAGGTAILARVTRDSAEGMGLVAGRAVMALVKAASFDRD